MKKRIKSKRSESFGYTLLFGLLANVTIFVMLSALASLILTRMADPMRILGIVFTAVFLLSGGLGSFITAKWRRGFGIYPSLLSSVLIILPLFSIGLIINGRISLAALISYISYVGISALASVLAKRETKRRRHR